MEQVALTEKEIADSPETESVESGGIRDFIKKATEKKPDEYELSVIEYNNAYTLMSDAGLNLYMTRLRTVDLIGMVEGLVNSIANTPKEFSRDMGTISSRKCEFTRAEEFAAEELNAARASALSAGAGVAAGMAVASMAPTAAMWIATTFGTASTGTAISALSGAAATNAALAWLGGGALAAGGMGMAGGSAFLALAGPIGWTIAGATLLASIALFTKSKFDGRKKKHEELLAVKRNTEAVRELALSIDGLLQKTSSLKDGVFDLYMNCNPLYGGDYLSYGTDQRRDLGSLVNTTLSLSALLTVRVGETSDDEGDK